MTDFERALHFVLKAEGGFTNDLHDHGGVTNRGILQREYTAWRRANGAADRSVKEITDAEAADIYLHSYWLPAKCDRMAWPVCLAHFDAAVNTGLYQAAVFLQRVVGVKVDGVIGPVTLTAQASEISNLGAQQVAARLAEARRPFYRHLAATDPSQEEFLNGWLNRVDDVQKLIKAEYV